MRARQYDPNLGRFLSVDPVQGAAKLPQTWNRYHYGRNNPLVFSDPTELAEQYMAIGVGPVYPLSFGRPSASMSRFLSGLFRTATGWNYAQGSWSYFRGIARAKHYHDRLSGTLGGDQMLRATAENKILVEVLSTVPPLAQLIAKHRGDIQEALQDCLTEPVCVAAAWSVASMTVDPDAMTERGQIFAGRVATVASISYAIGRSGGGKVGSLMGVTAFYGDIRWKVATYGDKVTTEMLLYAVMFGE